MQTIAAYSIPQIYSAYGIDIGQGYNESGKIVRREQYYCAGCRTGFTVDHNYHGMQGNFDGFRDHVVYCPNCGRRHESWWNGPSFIGRGKDTLPESISLQLLESKDLLLLRVKAKTFRFVEDKEHCKMELGTRTEEFRFDVKRRKSEFILRNKGAQISKRYEIGAPFDAPIFTDSILSHLVSNNHSREYAGGITEVLATLRRCLRKKWKQIHGYDIGSLHVGCGTVYGRMLGPLHNIAYRLVYADAENLPSFLRMAGWARDQALKRMLVGDEAMERFRDLDRIRKGKDTVSAVMDAFGLPQAPFIRRLLSADIFQAAELLGVCKVTRNLDYIEALWKAMGEKKASHFDMQNAGKVYSLLQELSGRYSMRSLLAYVRRADWHDMQDTWQMLSRLLPERKEPFWKSKPKLKDLHDSLIQALRHQKENGFELKVPEHVRKRLTMQMDRLKFFLPEHSFELMRVGDELCNCVRTYDEKMRRQECNIVPVTDDNGKLVACLEVRGCRLVQAKLKHNRPVYLDAVLNGEVIRWAGKAGLKIDTTDIRMEAAEAAATA